MDFAYSPRLRELKQRTAALAERFMLHEDDCENHGGLSGEVLASMRADTLSFGLQAINMPLEWGGAGLSVLEQVVVQEELGKLTNGLWDVVWRPASALSSCTPEQRERWRLPCIRGDRRDAVAITEPEAGSNPQSLVTTAEPAGSRFRLNGEKCFVTVGDHADFLLVLATVPGAGRRGRGHVPPAAPAGRTGTALRDARHRPGRRGRRRGHRPLGPGDTRRDAPGSEHRRGGGGRGADAAEGVTGRHGQQQVR